MKLLIAFLILLVSVSILSCQGQTSNAIQLVEPQVFANKIKTNSNALIIDVRTPEEFASNHIDRAINIDILSKNFELNIKKLDSNDVVLVYCKSGGRSSKAALKLETLGFKEIYNLDGGMIKWDAEGHGKTSKQIIGISTQEYQALTKKKAKVLIDFKAKWCAPCQKMATYLSKMQKELTNTLMIIPLDVDENKTLVQEMYIQELPTLILYENGKMKWNHSGYISEEDLKKQL